MLRTTKPPRCKVCKSRLDQLRPGQVVHESCIEEYVRRLRAEKAERLAKAERQIRRKRKEAIKTIPTLIREADKAFADFIRARDRLAGFPCISSGKPLDWSGNKVDAGHYRSRGAASHLRYDEDNCHAQSKQDNLWKSGNVVEYRIKLVQRIGIERVERLESSNEVHQWDRDELIGIRKTYQAKAKELKARTA